MVRATDAETDSIKVVLPPFGERRNYSFDLFILFDSAGGP